MTEINRTTLRLIEADALAALETVATKHGIAFKFGSGRFTADNATLKLEVAVMNADGTAETKEVSDFKAMAQHYGLKAEHLGEEIRIRGTTYTICGLKRKSKKYPIIAETANGKRFKFEAAQVLEAFRWKEMAGK